VLLCVDIGNTNITLGVFDGNCLIETFRLASDKKMSQEEYKSLFLSKLKNFTFTECVIGSVVEGLDILVDKICSELFDCTTIICSPENCKLIKLDVQFPQTVGMDRIANALGAKAQYKLPTIVIDIGTAITFDIISKEGNFIGGIISAGINLQLKALNTYTSKLPLVEIEQSPKAIGNNTQNSILSGVIRGTACAIEGLISQCEQELGEKAFIVATGGQCEIISQYMNREFDKINHNLTLEGLKEITKLSFRD
jgi:type III pantothenate kinase